MGKKAKYRVAIVAEFESDLSLQELPDWISLSVEQGRDHAIFVPQFETFELEELDYPDIKLEEL